MLPRFLLIVHLLMLLAAPPGRASETAVIEPALTPDKELLAKIEALPDNTWLKLPPVKTAGDLSWCGKKGWPNTEAMPQFGPSVRGYSSKMVWAADRKRAMYCGANHQAPHFLNDVWEYDLAANTWVCVYAPDPPFYAPSVPTPESIVLTKEWIKKNVILKDGVLQTPRGAPVRPIHTWSGLTYDSDRHRMLLFVPKGRSCALLQGNNLELIAEVLGFKDLKDLQAHRRPGNTVAPYTNNHIWSLDPVAKTWEILTEDVPVFNEGEAADYIPDRKQVWTSCAMQVYDPDKKTTTDLKPTDKTDLKSPGKIPWVGEVVAAYAPEFKSVVILSQNVTRKYSFATNETAVVQLNALASGADMRSFFCYDTVAKKFVLDTVDKGPKGENQPGYYLYDLEKNEWTDAKPQGDVPPPGGGAGYYDPERNVTVKYAGRDVWVYRCKRTAKP